MLRDKHEPFESLFSNEREKTFPSAVEKAHNE